MTTTAQIVIKGPNEGRSTEVLTSDALAFVGRLQRQFGNRRLEILRHRDERQARLDAGESPRFLVDTESVRTSEWRVARAPRDLEDRRVEITGPTDRKMLINALNSGARVFMADFEDANSPTWANLVEGQVNLIDAIERRIDFTSPE
jgi:malate synthase